MGDFIRGPWTTDGDSDWTLDTGGWCTYYNIYDNKGTSIAIVAVRRPSEEPRLEALKSIMISAPDLYNALWEAVELSDRTMPPSVVLLNASGFMICVGLLLSGRKENNNG